MKKTTPDLKSIFAQVLIKRPNSNRKLGFEATPTPVRPHVSRMQFSTPAELGAIVRAARKRHGMTQADFADLAGVGRRFLIELEQGKPRLELGKVLIVLAAAGIDLIAQER